MKLRKKFFMLFAVLAVIELTIWSYTALLAPIPSKNLATKNVYEFLARDKDRFRVFCVTRCLSQKTAAIYNLELIEGYNTLAQYNYYKETWQLMGGYWNYYTLAIPPAGAVFSKLEPDAKSLGEYNTKYVISPYSLTDKNFELASIIDNFYVYKNKLYLPRATAPIVIFSPNLIRVDTSHTKDKSIILREVYSPAWKAYLNGTKEVEIQETPIAQRLVDLAVQTQFVDFIYKPWGF